MDAFLLAAKRLSKLSRTRKWSLTNLGARTSPYSLEAYNVASGSSSTVTDLIDKVIRLTQSKSPIQYIPGDDRFPNVYRGSIEKISRDLTFEPKVTVEEGVLRLTRLHLQRTERSLSNEIETRCDDKTLRPNVTSSDLTRLNGCSAHVTVNIQGEVAVLRPDHDHAMWIANGKMPPDGLHAYIKAGSQPESTVVSFQAGDKDVFLGIKRPLPEGPGGPVDLVTIERHEIADSVVDWEVEIDNVEGTVRLLVVDTKMQLKPPANVGGRFSLAASGDGEGEQRPIYPFRISPICCSGATPWPWFQDDRKWFVISHG